MDDFGDIHNFRSVYCFRYKEIFVMKNLHELVSFTFL